MHPFNKLNKIGFAAVATANNRAYGVNPLPDRMLASAVDVASKIARWGGLPVCPAWA